MSTEGKKTIIIKRPIIAAGGHHGGSWKVAYADFVTAMMAFFLLMWLLNISTDEKKEQIQQYFKTYSLIQGGGGLGASSSDSGSSSSSVLAALDGGRKCQDDAKLFAKSQQELALLEGEIKASLNKRLTGLESGVSIHVVGSAVRIELTQHQLFLAGGSALTPLGEKIIATVGEQISLLGRPIEIEGHSDGTRFGDVRYSNWDLSVERALMIRRVFQKNDLKLEVQRVSGLADQMPLYPGNPGDPRNRRITVVVPVLRKTSKPETLGEQVPETVSNGIMP
jgi:chemotaxis protein MotB